MDGDGRLCRSGRIYRHQWKPQCLIKLIKLIFQPDTKGSYVEFLERYVNLGLIVDFCVVDFETQGQGQVVTCLGANKNGSVRIVRNEIGINEQGILVKHSFMIERSEAAD
ncbi:hypothetical protein L2E82_14787 [Cichorium intybus]|uniref:Uncharacterized protein n=1 Tax=Cichorium intybus TaxID=13427 RepID=A0ACB9F247_CICIN|nr:hypothetical protein L2E82_14787 [Cichorium intybus]